MFACLRLLPLLAGAAGLFAQDFHWGPPSARAIGQGGIFTPSPAHVLDSLAANPAGLASLGAPVLDLSLSAARPFGSFRNAASPSVSLATGFAALPGLGFGAPIRSSRFSFGLGLLPALASRAEWRYNDALGAGGASYGLRSHVSSIVALRSAFGVGLRVNRRLALGASYGLVYNTNRLDAPYTFQSHPALRGLKTLLDLRTSGLGHNFTAGLWFKAHSRWQLGLAYKSRTIITSTGSATGSLSAQFAAAGIAASPDFRYDAAVRNVLPQSLHFNSVFRLNTRTTLATQGDWVNWRSAFRSLPVSLTNGSNSAVNQLLGSTSLADSIPLDWKDRYAARLGLERTLTDDTTLRTGFATGTGIVPASTVNPLTAALWRSQITAGLSRRIGQSRLDLAYAFNLPSTTNVARSALAGGDYNNSRLRIGLHTLTLSTSFAF